MSIENANRQWVACKFSSGDSRAYTYHNDGPPVVIGDKVDVETKRGRATVEVIALPEEAPKFPTKPILGKVSLI